MVGGKGGWTRRAELPLKGRVRDSFRRIGDTARPRAARVKLTATLDSL